MTNAMVLRYSIHMKIHSNNYKMYKIFTVSLKYTVSINVGVGLQHSVYRFFHQKHTKHTESENNDFFSFLLSF